MFTEIAMGTSHTTSQGTIAATPSTMSREAGQRAIFALALSIAYAVATQSPTITSTTIPMTSQTTGGRWDIALRA
ncbi:MAG: hypothetical protein ABJE10_24215 [bacterium]